MIDERTNCAECGSPKIRKVFRFNQAKCENCGSEWRIQD